MPYAPSMFLTYSSCYPSAFPQVVVAFNPLVWSRSEVIRFPVSSPYLLVTDASGAPIPSQILRETLLSPSTRSTYIAAYTGMGGIVGEVEGEEEEEEGGKEGEEGEEGEEGGEEGEEGEKGGEEGEEGEWVDFGDGQGPQLRQQKKKHRKGQLKEQEGGQKEGEQTEEEEQQQQQQQQQQAVLSLVFSADVPPLGFATFFVSPAAQGRVQQVCFKGDPQSPTVKDGVCQGMAFAASQSPLQQGRCSRAGAPGVLSPAESDAATPSVAAAGAEAAAAQAEALSAQAGAAETQPRKAARGRKTRGRRMVARSGEEGEMNGGERRGREAASRGSGGRRGLQGGGGTERGKMGQGEGVKGGGRGGGGGGGSGQEGDATVVLGGWQGVEATRGSAAAGADRDGGERAALRVSFSKSAVGMQRMELVSRSANGTGETVVSGVAKEKGVRAGW
ncbi:unnamed protein product [Closterium sp. NIES-54]